MAEDIHCPICKLNLQVFSLRQREEHCDTCLDVEPAELINTQQPSPLKKEIEPIHGDRPIEAENETVPQEKLELKKEQRVPFVTSGSQVSRVSFLGKRPRSISPSASASATRQKTWPTVSEPARSTPNGIPVSKAERKPIPFYKTLTFGKTKVAVDAFNYGPIPGVDAYFLTHFHSDHYGGLGKNWSQGVIYCSPATARLAILKLKVNPEYLRPLPLGQEYTIKGVNVLFLDANHCPGAAVILFNKHTLHTGDFRATPQLAEAIKRVTPSLRATYLDTTYLDPGRRFPSQDLVVNLCAEYCCLQQEKPVKPSFFLKQPKQRRILVLVGTYTIGKERLALSIAQRLKTKIWATPQKRKVLDTIDDPDINKLLDDDGLHSQVHLAGMNELSVAKLEEKWKFLKKHFTHMIAFVPTGWTWPAKSMDFNIDALSDPRTTTVSSGGMIRICRVPYSEHSSYVELEQFCRLMPSEKLIATVHTSHYDILKSWEA